MRRWFSFGAAGRSLEAGELCLPLRFCTCRGGHIGEVVGTCGGLVGGTIALDYFFGRPARNMSYQVGNAARWVMEILLDKGAIEGAKGKVREHTARLISSNQVNPQFCHFLKHSQCIGDRYRIAATFGYFIAPEEEAVSITIAAISMRENLDFRNSDRQFGIVF